jgi:hypothetical protein
MKEWQIHKAYGAMTDVMELKDQGLKVAAANISCGYYRPHTSREYIHIKEMRYTLDFVTTLLRALGSQPWLHSTPERVYKSSGMTLKQAPTGCEWCGALDVLEYDLESDMYMCMRCQDWNAEEPEPKWMLKENAIAIGATNNG